VLERGNGLNSAGHRLNRVGVLLSGWPQQGWRAIQFSIALVVQHLLLRGIATAFARRRRAVSRPGICSKTSITLL
jgi:hypothetical protein